MKSIFITLVAVLFCMGADLRAEDWSGRYQVKVSWYERAKDAPKINGAFGYGPSRSSGPTKQKSAEAMMEELGGKQVLQVVLPMCKDRTVLVDARIAYPHEGPSKGHPGEGWDGAVSWIGTKGDGLELEIKFRVSTFSGGDKEHPIVSCPMMGMSPTLSLDTPLYTMEHEFGMIVELQKADPRPEFGWDLYEVPISKDRPKPGGFGPLTGEDNLISRLKLENTEKFGSLRIPLVKGAKVTVTGLPGEDGKPMDNIPSGAVKWIPLPNPKIYRLEMETWMKKIVAGDEVSKRAMDKTTIELQEGDGMAMGGIKMESTEVYFIIGVTPAQP